MRLNEKIIEEIAKSIKKGMYIKDAVKTVGINERTYERWNKEGLKIEAKCYDDDGERIEKEWRKLSGTEKLKCRFCRSVRLFENNRRKNLSALSAHDSAIRERDIISTEKKEKTLIKTTTNIRYKIKGKNTTIPYDQLVRCSKKLAKEWISDNMAVKFDEINMEIIEI